MLQLEGARVLVVGGSSGIGLATAKAVIEAGGTTCIASRDVDRLAQASSAIGGSQTLVLDVADEDQTRSTLADAGVFDHIVVTAGGVAPAPVTGQSTAKAAKGFETKFWGAYRVAAFANHAARGSLTLISGVYASRPAPGSVAASCVNAAVEALARGLALELAPFRVNAVAPGLVDTPLWKGMDEGRRKAFFAEAERSLPARRVAAPEDIAALVLTCMTNPVMTGSILTADGGHVLV